MVIVSHDRHMLKTVTDELLIVDDKKVIPFAGDLDDYAQWIKNKDKSAQLDLQPIDTENKVISRKEQRKRDADLRKKFQPLKRIIDKLEKQLDQLHAKQQQLENDLADSDLYLQENKNKLKQALVAKSTVDKSLEDIEMQWMEASEDYEHRLGGL